MQGNTMAEPQRIEVLPAPHMPAAGVARLTELLRVARCYLEYGSGGSTVLAAGMNVPDIFTVESDAPFLEAVIASVAAKSSRSVLHAIHADIGPTRKLGYPADRSAIRRWADYALLPWDKLRALGMMPDFVLIDGRFRVACALASILNLPEGRLIMLDDYVGREDRYGAIQRHAALVEIVGVGAIFRTGAPDDRRLLAADLARFSVVAE